MLFIGMPSEFMQIIFLACPWPTSNKFNHLGDGNQYHPEMEVDFVQASRFIDVISDNRLKCLYLQVFFREYPLQNGLFTLCLLLTSKQDVG